MTRLGLALRCQAAPSSLIKVAISAEKAGFDSAWLVEVTEVDVMALAGLLSQATSKIKIATGVVNSTLRAPTLLAMGATTVSELSNGRFILGVGAGRPQVSQRNPKDTELTRLLETIQILKLCLSGESVQFQGKLYEVSGFKLGLKPSHKIQIFGAAMGQKMVETVAKVADGVLLMMPTMEYFKKTRETIYSALGRRGIPRSEFPIGCHFVTSVSLNKDKAERIAKMSVATYSTRPSYRKSYVRMGFQDEVEAIDKAKGQDAWKLVPREMAERLIIYGTPEGCMKKINEFVKEGVTDPVVYPCKTGTEFPDNAEETIRLLSPFLQ